MQKSKKSSTHCEYRVKKARNYSNLTKVNTIFDNAGSDQKLLNICSFNPRSVKHKTHSDQGCQVGPKIQAD